MGVSKETVGVSPGAEYSPAPPPSESPDTAVAQSDVFKAQARVILDRIRYCYRGNRAADARKHVQQARWRSRAAHARSHGRPRGRYSLLHRRP